MAEKIEADDVFTGTDRHAAVAANENFDTDATRVCLQV